MKIRSILIICLFLFLTCRPAYAQVAVPDQIIGNWVNENTCQWEYGFFEHFAIYESDFWEYEAIQTKKDRIEIRLRKGVEQIDLKLRISKKGGGELAIAHNKGKAKKFKINQPGFFPYPGPDTTAFRNSGFQQDSVTIIGYYHNLAEYKKNAGNAQKDEPFKVSVPNFIMDESLEYFADIDSLGRFTIKFPVLNTQEVYLDWGRLTQRNVVEPGETLFLFADMADFSPKKLEKGYEDRNSFRSRPKRVLYMGNEARIHNEIAHYIPSSEHFNRDEAVKGISSDMDYLAAAKENYNARLDHLGRHLKNHPFISEKFKVYVDADEKYDLAFNLMQYRFNKRSKQEIAFEDGYMGFVDSTMDFDDPKLYTLTREYGRFIRDYLGYNGDLMNLKGDEKTGKLQSVVSVSVKADAGLEKLKKREYFNEEEKAILAAYEAINEKAVSSQATEKDSRTAAAVMNADTDKNQEIANKYNSIIEREEVGKALREANSEILAELSLMKRLSAEFSLIDSLFEEKMLRELLASRTFYKSMDNTRKPLSEDALLELDARLSTPSVKSYILDVHQHYKHIENKKISYLASLKNTEHLKDSRDADSLFSQLIAPYRGKVIYLDFWGTWCGPCRKQMPFANDLKKQLYGKDVVFMYLANNSPENSWKNVIKEMDLAGENVVHYRLPEEQESMIERKFSISSFPTYMLIDKAGNIVNDKAPQPEHKSSLISEIEKLLVVKGE